MIQIQVLGEMADAHEQEKRELSQQMIQEGKHSELEEALKEQEKRQMEQLESKKAELDDELHTAETKIIDMINNEKNHAITTLHKNVLEEVRSKSLTT